jgi:hypothetical protein
MAITIVYSRQSHEDSAQAFLTIDVAHVFAEIVNILALALFKLETILLNWYQASQRSHRRGQEGPAALPFVLLKQFRK